MQIPQGDENSSAWAWLMAAIITGGGILYKAWFALRRDLRDDRKGATGTVTYEELIASLREQLREERRLRAEIEAAAAKRIDELEAKVDLLEARLRAASKEHQ